MDDGYRSTSATFHVVQDGVVRGPLTRDEILRQIRQGSVRRSASIGPSEQGPWTFAADDAEFARALAEKDPVGAELAAIDDRAFAPDATKTTLGDTSGVALLAAQFVGGALAAAYFAMSNGREKTAVGGFWGLAAVFWLVFLVLDMRRLQIASRRAFARLLFGGVVCFVLQIAYFGLRRRAGGKLGLVHALVVQAAAIALGLGIAALDGA